MKKKIFTSILIVTFVAALVAIVSVSVLGVPFMENEILQELKIEAELISKGISTGGVEYLEGIPDNERRITLIDENGNVLFDTGVNANTLDNHKNREEIKQAIEKGYGSSIRFSDTMTIRTINYALKIDNNQIIRISVAQNYVLVILSWLIMPICVIISVIVLLSIILSDIVTRRILQPLNDLDLEHPEDSYVYEELKPLTRKIQVQNRKLKEKIYSELGQKQRRQSEFTANMTHELKTPLTSISGFAEILMQNDLEDNIIKDFAKSIYDEAARLITIVGDIIKLAEMDEKENEYHFENIDIVETSKDVITTLSSSAKNKNIEINLKGDKTFVYGEKRILHEMIYNLVDNAIKYNRKNGSVDIEIIKNKNNICFAVKDTGIGIPENEQKKIFERFYRVDKAYSKELGGTGLGLSIVQQGALLHNAKIELSSEVNIGTNIMLIFPANEIDIRMEREDGIK